MSTASHRRATVRPTNDKTMPIIPSKKTPTKKMEHTPTQKNSQNCCFRFPKRKQLSPLKFLTSLGHKMVSGIRCVSGKRCSKQAKSSSEKPKTFVATIDSHRAEAVDDCIEFFNSSSTLTRSNSVSK